MTGRPKNDHDGQSKRSVSWPLIALLLAVSAIVFPGGASAQQATDADVDRLIDNLQKTPASVFDLGLALIQSKMFASFAATKPEVLKPRNFLFLDVLYEDVGHRIRISLGHRSTGGAVDAMASECQDDVVLMQMSLVPNTQLSKLSPDLPEAKKDQICDPVTSNFETTANLPALVGDEVASPGANVCSHIDIWAEVLSADGQDRVSCSKAFYSPDVTQGK